MGKLYEALCALPSKAIGLSTGLVGVPAALWPTWFEKRVGAAVTAEEIQFAGIGLMAVSIVYFALLWWLKPTGGNDGAAGVAQTSQGPSSPNILGDGNTVAIGDGVKLMGDDNQRGNFNYGTNFGGQHFYEAPQVSPQDALKRDLRDLLAAADGRILFEIDRGNLDIETRMTTLQFERLKKIASTGGSALFIDKVDLTGRFDQAQISNGSFGPTTAEELQFRVKFQFRDELMQ